MAAPAPAAVGGAVRPADRGKDLAASTFADSAVPEQRAREAEAMVHRNGARIPPSAPSPRLMNQAPARALAQHPPASRLDTSGVPAIATAPAPAMENSLQSQGPAQVAVRRVTGRVVDGSEHGPISAAQVVIPGTVIDQTTTDSGTFNISVPADTKSLTVRRIGYLAETVPLTPGTTDYTIRLKRDVLRLEQQAVTTATTTIGSLNAPAAAKATVESQAAGAPAGQLRITLEGSRCQDRIVRVPTGALGLGLADSTDARLTSAPSQKFDQAGFAVRLVPDTASAPAGSWQPIGRDSALVKLQGPRVATQTRVGC
jgi:hypothetical protein